MERTIEPLVLRPIGSHFQLIGPAFIDVIGYANKEKDMKPNDFHLPVDYFQDDQGHSQTPEYKHFIII